MKKYYIILFLLPVFFSNAMYLYADKEATIADIYSQAINAFQKDEYLKAIALWEEILEKDPNQIPPKKMIEMAKKKIEELEAPLTEEARSLARSGKYAKARDKYIEVQAMSPHRTELATELDRLKSIMKYFNELTSKGKAQTLIRRACGKYIIEHEGRTVLEMMTYARQINKEKTISEQLDGLYDMMKSEFSKEYAEIKPVEGFTLYEQYTEEALNMMYDSNYVGTIDKCKRILMLEKDDVTALMRIGSSYYALNKLPEAEKFWKKVLEQEPGNKQVKKFLKVLKQVKNK